MSAIDLSIELDVDLVLITGDLFDHSRVREPLLEWTAEQLDRAGRPVVLLVGNHDCLDDTSVHHRFAAGDRCRQVQFIDDPDGAAIEVPGTDIVVWPGPWSATSRRSVPSTATPLGWRVAGT